MSECLNVGTQILINSPIDRPLTTCAVDPVSTIRVVKPLFECLNVDDDVTLLNFDPGGCSYEKAVMEINEETNMSMPCLSRRLSNLISQLNPLRD